jgi:hypothetical protein
LEHLHDMGWKCADQWMEKNFDAINVKSSIDVFDTFM